MTECSRGESLQLLRKRLFGRLQEGKPVPPSIRKIPRLRSARNDYSSFTGLLKKEKTWLWEVSSVALQQKLRDLGQAFQNFFDGRCGCPNFKSKHDKQAARFASNAFTLHGKKLSVRSWDCPRCEASHDRDINAADNIRTAGLAGASQKANDSGGHRKTRDAFRIERCRPTAHGPVNE